MCERERASTCDETKLLYPMLKDQQTESANLCSIITFTVFMTSNKVRIEITKKSTKLSVVFAKVIDVERALEQDLNPGALQH